MQAQATISEFLKNKSDLYFSMFIFGLALLLRIGYVLALKKYYFFYGHPSSDVTYYLDWANEILHGSWLGTKTFYGLPLFPYFLAVLRGLSLGNVAVMHFLYILLFLALMFHLLKRSISQHLTFALIFNFKKQNIERVCSTSTR